MSRINRPRVADGDNIDATDLNSRFTDYTQTGALNAYNTRDAAFDLPQFKNPGASTFGFLASYQNSAIIGANDWKHSSVVTVTGVSAAPPPATPFIVGNAAGSPTPISLGAAGVTVATGEVLRVYWDLSVYPHWEGSRPWTTGASVDFYVFDKGSGVAQALGTNAACWAFWLQWDITSNALANFVDVPNQSDFRTDLYGDGSAYGAQLADTMATSVVPAFIDRAAPDDGLIPSTPVSERVGWRGVSGSFYYPKTSGSQTIYGLRVVFTGPMSPNHNTTSGANHLIHSVAWSSSSRLSYAGGSIDVVKQRVG
jgi:hypothetical protein